MGVVVIRLAVQLALGVAFGASQLLFVTAAWHAVFSAGASTQPNASAIITPPPAPVGMGWG